METREVTWHEMAAEMSQLNHLGLPYRIDMSANQITIETFDEQLVVPERHLYKGCRTLAQRRQTLRDRISEIINTADVNCVSSLTIGGKLDADTLDVERMCLVLEAMISHPELHARQAFSRTLN